jgi:hypothetical protein
MDFSKDLNCYTSSLGLNFRCHQSQFSSVLPPSQMYHLSFMLLFKRPDSYDFFCFCSAGVWTQGFAFARQALYHLDHVFSSFCSGCFRNRVSLFAQVSLDHNPPTYTSFCSWDDRPTPSLLSSRWALTSSSARDDLEHCSPNLSIAHSWYNRHAPPWPAIDWDRLS